MMTPPLLRAASAGSHARRPDIAHEVELEGPVPVLVGKLVEGPHRAGADVVDENVERAAERLQRLAHRADDAVADAEVGDAGAGLGADAP